MIRVRVWFRKGGATDGLWWQAEVGGTEWDCADVEFRCPTRTGFEQRDDRPRAEQRHFIQADAESATWEGARLVVA